jgi:hypothetical protein
MIERRGRRGAAVLALVVAVLAGACNKNETSSPNTPTNDPVATDATGSVSFPLPSDTPAAVKLAGLPMLGQEMLDYHIHSHLDVVVDGKAVAVPANIGIDVEGGQISPLHTHDATGVIHIEAAKKDVFRVGQLFQEWGVTLNKTCLASFCADETHQLLGFDNGQLVPDPASIPFDEHAEIVIWYGPKGSNPQVPTSYSFPANL